MREKVSTHFLRAALGIIGVFVAIASFFIVSALYTGWNAEYPHLSSLRYPLVGILVLSVIPFFIALLQAFRLLDFIDKQQAFSRRSLHALGIIKYCACSFSLLYAASMYIIYRVAQAEDAPGLILITGTIFVGAPIAVAVFVAVLQRLLDSVITLKSEHDLTV